MPFQSGIGKPGQKKNLIERQNFRLKPLSEDPHPPAVNQLFFVTASQHIFKFPGVFDKIAFMIKGEKSQSFFLTFDFGLKSVNLCESLKGLVHF